MMENWQRELITEHLPFLIENTTFDTVLISMLLSKKVISKAEANFVLQGTSPNVDISNYMYTLLQTKLHAYEILRDCLEKTQQSGARSKLCSPVEQIKSIYLNKDILLGTGSNGTKVYLGEYLGRKVAVKIVNLGIVDPQKAIKEVQVLRKLEFHNNVLQCLGYEEAQPCIYIALELCKITLDEWVKTKTPNIERIEILKQATTGLQYLHANNIIHRDIKPKNILLGNIEENSVKVKIGDLGLSRRIYEETTTTTFVQGTRDWMAPEILNFAYNSEKAVLKMSHNADIFSLGCVYFFVLSFGSHPFGTRPFIEGNIIKGKYELDALLEHLGSNSHSSMHLIKAMIASNEKFRPSCDTIQKHNLFWSSRQWLEFLSDIGDLITAKSHQCIALLNAIRIKRFTTQVPWHDLTCEVVQNYLSSSTCFSDDLIGLIQAINYMKKRYDTLPDPVKIRLGSMPDGFMGYWLSRFPALFQRVYISLQKMKTSSSMTNYYCESYIYKASNFHRKPSQVLEHDKETRGQFHWPNTFKISGVLTILVIILSYFFGAVVIPCISDLNTNFDDSPKTEICEESSMQIAMNARSNLDNLLRDNLFGQHLAHNILIREIYNHLGNPDPSKPLTLSFHGSPGLGKRLTSVLVMRALYQKGENSEYVRIFTANRDFTEPEFLLDYKKNLTTLISDAIKRCSQSLFVLDGVDILPVGLLDALIPLVSHPDNDYKRAIYIFIGDSGDLLINKLAHDNWKANNRRTDLKQEQFDKFLSNEAFKVSGGWYKSVIDERIMVSKFVPFLPMEKRHVLECFRRLAKSRKKFIFSEDEFEEMASSLEYWPNNTSQFSKMGCEKVASILNARTTEKEFWLNKQL